MVRHHTDDTDADVAVIQVDPENHASARVPPRVGFRPLGERIAANGDRLMVFGLRLRPATGEATGELTLSDVCPQ